VEDQERYAHERGGSHGSHARSGKDRWTREVPAPVDDLPQHETPSAAVPPTTDGESPAPRHGAQKPAAAHPAEGGTFIASKSSKKFHKADCKGAADIKPANKITFATRAEAAEGRTPAKDCNP
jgi:hypothetical protein